LVTDVISLMRVRADEKSIRLLANVIGPLPETVLTDPLRLRQILVNLVGNAIKFAEQGEVRVTVRLSDADSRLRMDVSDTGIGMDEQQMAQLFQPFNQVDGSASRRFGGTGLGLAISKRLVEALGGEIQVQSTPGQGSTFSVTIDPGPLEGISLTEQAVPMVEPVACDRGSTSNGVAKLNARVLLAEDGPDTQRLIRFLLEKAGAEVTAVDNGRTAIEIALGRDETDQPFDVILMDMQMPVMDGYAAARQLRDAGYSRPIIALTAHAMNTDRYKCLHAGCDDYAAKPIDRDALIALIAKHASQPADRVDVGGGGEQGR
jgi:CheY-like chemotaxis protein